MAFPIPDARNRDTVDAQRDEAKRQSSPGSFFFSQGRSLVLAANYFTDERLREDARGGVALKHRHKIQLALFGQLMASFEFFLKDFVAKAIDASTQLDEVAQRQPWLQIDVGRVLANRSGMATVGSTLVHSTQGWHSPEQVNNRYKALFKYEPFDAAAVETLEKLWVIRHSVAHNAGMVIHYDATRIGNEGLANHAADIDGTFISETFAFLHPIAQNACEKCGENLLKGFFGPLAARGPDFFRDMPVYAKLHRLWDYTASRTQELDPVNEQQYLVDFQTFSQP